jgi:hypothetical protein
MFPALASKHGKTSKCTYFQNAFIPSPRKPSPNNIIMCPKEPGRGRGGTTGQGDGGHGPTHEKRREKSRQEVKLVARDR